MSPARDHLAALDLKRLASGCEFRRTRRSGPGGQNRNKVETAIVLVHRPSGIVAEATSGGARVRTSAPRCSASG